MKTRRDGAVLVVVLVVILLLTLGAYSFTEQMLLEAEATSMYVREVQARAVADSGVELVAAVLGRRSAEPTMINLFDNPQLFRGVLVRDADHPRRRARFSVVAPFENDPAGTVLRYGLVDESSKLNLNALVNSGLTEEQQRESLMKLPEMTVEIADAILDWIDADERPRQFGAENEYYGGLDPPYAAKNGRLDSLDELLQVRGVTPWLLYGEDANRNGILDAGENDGEASYPFDNADGVLQTGWSAFLTVDSREANVRADGSLRINVNQDDLADLYDALAAEFDEETARFIVAYRLFGPSTGSGSGSQAGGSQPGGSRGSDGSSGRSGGRSSGRGGGGSGSGSSGGSGSTTTPPSGTSAPGGGTPSTGGPSASTDGSGGAGTGGGGASGGGMGGGGLSGGGTRGSSGGGQSGAGSGQSGGSGSSGETRGGLDVSGSGARQINSLYELIGASVSARVNQQQQTLESPWSDDPSKLAADLPMLLDALTTNSNTFIEGRINISQARQEVLLTVPGVDEQLAMSVLGAQVWDGAAGATAGTRTTTAWLVTEGIVNVEQMRTLDRYITARGDVYRTQVVGFYDAGGAVSRLEAVIDATQFPPRIVSVRDLTDLGRGYTPEQLSGLAGGFRERR